MDFNIRYGNSLKGKDKFTLTEAAFYLEGVSTRTVLRWVAKGLIKRHWGRGSGRHGYYLKSELDEFYLSERNKFI